MGSASGTYAGTGCNPATEDGAPEPEGPGPEPPPGGR